MVPLRRPSSDAAPAARAARWRRSAARPRASSRGQRLQAIQRASSARSRSSSTITSGAAAASCSSTRQHGDRQVVLARRAARQQPARAGSRGPRARSGCRAATTSRPRGDRRRRAGDARAAGSPPGSRRRHPAGRIAAARSARPASNVSPPSRAGAHADPHGATAAAATRRPSAQPVAPRAAKTALADARRPTHRHPLRHAEARGAFERRVELRQLRLPGPRTPLDPAHGARTATLSVMARFKQARAVRPETRPNETRSDGGRLARPSET